MRPLLTLSYQWSSLVVAACCLLDDQRGGVGSNCAEVRT
jgi:hypothetical protein